MHSPETKEEVENVNIYRRRLAFDELISNYFAIRYLKEINQKKENKNNLLEDLQIELTKNLPFQLTDKQNSCLGEINNLNKGEYKETILLQGDVGSGKTVVALLSAMPYIQSDYQVAYMAPTEILAIQIFNNLNKLFLNAKIKPILLTGSSKNKEEIQLDIKNNKYKSDNNPLDINCSNLNLNRYSINYLNHLFNTNEILRSTLLSLHNINFYQELMSAIRENIKMGTFDKFHDKYIDKL